MLKVFLILFFVFLLSPSLFAQSEVPVLEFSYTSQNENPMGGASLLNPFTLFVLPNQETYSVKVTDSLIQSFKIPYNKLPPGFDTSYFDNLKEETKKYQLLKKDIEKKIFIHLDLATKIQISHQYDYADNTFYDVIDTLREFDWELIDSFKTIYNYKCQLAKGNLHNKTYLAWFAAAIPVSAGPAKLCGLPGMILEAKSTDGAEIYFPNALYVPAKNEFDKHNYSYSKKQISFKENYQKFQKQLKILQIQSKLDKN